MTAPGMGCRRGQAGGWHVLRLLWPLAALAVRCSGEDTRAATLFFQINYQGPSADVPCCGKRALFDADKLRGGSARVQPGMVLVLHTESPDSPREGSCSADGRDCQPNPTVRIFGDASDLTWHTDQRIVFVQVMRDSGLKDVSAVAYTEHGYTDTHSIPLRVGDHDHTDIPNDALRAFRVPNGLLVTYKEHALGFPGRSGTCGSGQDCVLRGWADRGVSSVRVQVLPGTALYARLHPPSDEEQRQQYRRYRGQQDRDPPRTERAQSGRGTAETPTADGAASLPLAFAHRLLQTDGAAMTGCITARGKAHGAAVRVAACAKQAGDTVAGLQRWTSTGCGQLRLDDTTFCLAARLHESLPSPLFLDACNCDDFGQREAPCRAHLKARGSAQLLAASPLYRARPCSAHRHD